MRRTIGEEIKIVQSLVPATRTSTTSSETVVDTLGFDNVCWEVLAGNGTFGGGTPETYSFAVHESDNADGSSDAAITGASASVTADNQVKKIQIKLGGGRKRYQFIRLTAAGSSPSLPCAGVAILGVAHRDPQQAPDASV